MIYGYIRVSSYGQLDGASPEEQEQQIRAAAVLVNGGEPEIFFDRAVSGGMQLQKRPAGKLLLAKRRQAHKYQPANFDTANYLQQLAEKTPCESSSQ